MLVAHGGVQAAGIKEAGVPGDLELADDQEVPPRDHPFPFGEPGGPGQEGESGDPRNEKVEIPGAEAHRVPEEFRRDLMEAMKQGAPERYRNEVQRYYEELVK